MAGAITMTPEMWLTFLAQGFVGEIPVWDQSRQTIVGYRTSYGDPTIHLISGIQATPGAILYTPDFFGNLVELDVSGAGASGTAAGAFKTATGATASTIGTFTAALPGWALPAAIGAGLVLLLTSLGRR